MDLITYTEEMPQIGETIRGKDFQMGFGGKGANQCVAAGRLGARVAMVSRVGDDSFGRETLANYAAAGVGTALVRVTAGAPTGVAQITVDAAGRNAIVIVPGANDAMAPAADAEGAPAFVALVRGARLLVCQLEVPLAATVSALRVARAHGVPTLLNPAPAALPTATPAQCALVREMFALTDVLVPNETELATLAGVPVRSVADAERAAARVLRGAALAAAGAAPRFVLVTLGAGGALLAHRDPATGAVATRLAPLAGPPVTAVDTTGAGDCFIGALAFFLVRELAAGTPADPADPAFFDALARAVPKASVVATNSVTKRGTQISYPRPDELPQELFQ